jgi:2-dehydropantoate 2-reductase
VVIGVMGAGAVGSYFGGKLAKAGHEVIFVARGEHLDRMRRNGLVVKSTGGDFHLIPRAVGLPEEAGPCDLILFTPKNYDTETAARAMAPMLADDTVVIPLQNGVDNEERLSAIIGPRRVIGGLCYVGARIDRPGEVIHSAAGRVIIGELDGRHTIRIAQVERLFLDAGVTVEVSLDIRADKWRKFCWNISFNTVSALTRATVGQMLALESCREVIRTAVAEGVAVARTRGVRLPEDFPDRVLADNAVYRDLKTSMLQDLEKGRPLEADSLSGVVVRYADEAGVPVPVNRTLYGLLSCLGSALRA